MSFLGLLLFKVTNVKKGINMQMYCLNDDRGLAGFTQCLRMKKNKAALSLLKDGFVLFF